MTPPSHPLMAAEPHSQSAWSQPSGPRADIEEITVVGSGNSAHALACYLSSQGHLVHLLVRGPERFANIVSQRKIFARGVLEGIFPIEGLTDDPARALATCSTVFVATTTNPYFEIAQRLSPHLRQGHRVLLFSSKFGGSQDFSMGLGKPEIPVIETDALLASRVQPDSSVWIRGIKQWNLYSAPRCSQTQEHAHLMLKFFPDLKPAKNLVQRGLTDFGALAHPLTMIANMNQVDKQVPFLFYCDGFTERTVILLEQMQREFCQVAEAYHTELMPASQLLNHYYGCKTDTLLEAMRSVPNYRTSLAPITLQHRYLSEDVACTLVPAQQLAQLAGMKTPIIDSVITLASLLYGEDLAQTGRTLQRLGWGGLSYQQLLAWFHS